MTNLSHSRSSTKMEYILITDSRICVFCVLTVTLKQVLMEVRILTTARILSVEIVVPLYLKENLVVKNAAMNPKTR